MDFHALPFVSGFVALSRRAIENELKREQAKELNIISLSFRDFFIVTLSEAGENWQVIR